MENPRTESARDHDDSAIIDAVEDAPSQGTRSGGNLARDVATRAEAERIDDPDGTTGVNKQDDLDNGTAYPSDRPRGG